MVNMCLSVLSHHLFDGALSVSRRVVNGRNGRKRKRSEGVGDVTLTQEDQQRWSGFLHRALVDIVAWGFVAFHDDLGEVDIARCTATLGRDTGEITVKPLYGTRTITTINAFGYSPDFNGEPTSIMSTLLPWIAFVNTLRGCTSTLELKKIAPDMVVERAAASKGNTVTADDLVMRTPADQTDGQMPFSECPSECFIPTTQFLDSVGESMRRGARDAAALVGEGSRESGPPRSQTTLPEMRTLAHIGTANGRTDIVGLIRGTQQLVCAALGVPRTMIINDSVARADTTATHDRLRAALKKYRQQLEHVFTVAYNVVQPETSAYASGHMPDVFYGPPETLAQMWLLGVITFERYTSILAATFGLAPPVGTIDLFTPEQRTEIAAECMRNIITQHHGRT